MATQTRFELNAAVENWRNELAAQTQLSSEDRRELEKHLADTMSELRQRGLNDEESFWLARRRIGQPQQLAAEFEKTDPAKVWRERVLWMALAFLFFNFWTSLVEMIPFHFGWTVIVFVCLIYLPPVYLAVLLAKGRLNADRYISGSIFKDRWFFVGIAIIFLLVTHGVQTWESYEYVKRGVSHPGLTFWMNEIQSLTFPLMIVAVAAWLLPAQKRPAKSSS
jgi:hypothetical protein